MPNSYIKKYTIKDFNKQFPDDDACLDYLFRLRFPTVLRYYKVKGRLIYQDNNGFQISPLASSVFRDSDTSLKLWFYAIYLFSVSKTGVSAKELERQLGVGYKTAWRIANRIRSKIKESTPILRGIVEVDEAYVGGKKRLNVRRNSSNKTIVLGLVERQGQVVMKVIPNTRPKTLHDIITNVVEKGSTIMTDGLISYKGLNQKGYTHKSVNHTSWEYVRKEGNLSVHTNTIEGVWHGLKKQIEGTHHHVGVQYLEDYLAEIVFRYNHRHEVLFPILLKIICL